MKILAQEVPLIPIAHSKRYQARGNNVTGNILAPFGGINFYPVAKNAPLQKNVITKMDIDDYDGDENTGDSDIKIGEK